MLGPLPSRAGRSCSCLALYLDLETLRGTHREWDSLNVNPSLCHSRVLCAYSSNREGLIFPFSSGNTVSLAGCHV